MFATNMLSFMDLGFSLDRVITATVVGVLVLAVYEASVLIAALLATRSERVSGRASQAGPTRPAGS